MIKMVKVLDGDNSKGILADNKILVSTGQVEHDGITFEVVKGVEFSEDRFEDLDRMPDVATPQKFVSSAPKMTTNRLYTLLSCWASEKETYVIVKNDYGQLDDFKLSRFTDPTPKYVAPAAPVASAVAVKATGIFVKATNINGARPKTHVKRLTLNKVYELVRPLSTNVDVLWITNDAGLVEDFKKSRFVQVSTTKPAPVVAPKPITWYELGRLG